MDGDRQHFKQSTVVTLMVELAEELNVTIHLIYFVAGHGKFLCDEHGGCAKDRIDVLVTERSSSRQPKHIIRSASDAVAAMNADPCPLKNTYSFLLPPDPAGPLYKGSLVQSIDHMGHAVCRPGDKRVFLAVHPDDCAECMSPKSGGCCRNKDCTKVQYLHSGRVRNDDSGKWLYEWHHELHRHGL